MADPLLANHAAAVTPSDSQALPSGSSWIAFSNSGAQVLVIDTVGGELAVSITLPTGMYPIRAAKVRAATTVTNIIAFWQ